MQTSPGHNGRHDRVLIVDDEAGIRELFVAILTHDLPNIAFDEASNGVEAVEHFQNVLIPGIASGELEPLAAWREYGCRLAEWIAEGRTVEIDETGLSRPHDPSTSGDGLVLHLPDDTGQKAILVSLPEDVTRAQRATYDLLVAGKQTLRG